MPFVTPPFTDAAEYCEAFSRRLVPSTDDHLPVMPLDLRSRGRAEITSLNACALAPADEFHYGAELNPVLASLVYSGETARAAGPASSKAK